MDIPRPTYLKQLADAMGNGMVKIVTGIRRCGKVYIQSAFAISDDQKMRQETASLRKTGDFFRKVVVTGGSAKPWKDESGIEFTGLIPFLLDPKSHLGAVNKPPPASRGRSSDAWTGHENA